MPRRVFSYATGRWLELPDLCSRVVSFSPAVTDSIVSMGIADILKGISSYCVHPNESVRSGRIIVGSYSKYRKEVLREIDPELIFTTTGYQLGLAMELSETYNVYAVRVPLTLAELISSCAEVGLVCGYHDRARELELNLIRYTQRFLYRGDKKYRVYVEVDLGGPVTFGAYSYVTDTLSLLGFENIFGDHPASWLEPDPKAIEENDPDVIIYEPSISSRSESQRRFIDMLASRMGRVRAVREKRIFITPGPYDLLTHHGPSFVLRCLPFLSEIFQKISSDVS